VLTPVSVEGDAEFFDEGGEFLFFRADHVLGFRGGGGGGGEVEGGHLLLHFGHGQDVEHVLVQFFDDGVGSARGDEQRVPRDGLKAGVALRRHGGQSGQYVAFFQACDT